MSLSGQKQLLLNTFIYSTFLYSTITSQTNKNIILLNRLFPIFFILACAKKFSAEGSKVVLCARNEVELKRVKKEISGDEVCYTNDKMNKQGITY